MGFKMCLAHTNAQEAVSVSFDTSLRKEVLRTDWGKNFVCFVALENERPLRILPCHS